MAATELLFHRVRLPPPGQPTDRYPAVVMVHGWLGNEKVMSVFERALPPGVVILSPRAPIEAGPEAYGWYPRDSGPADLERGVTVLEDFVRAASARYPVDPARVALVGFSQGAAMCYALLARRPQIASAVAGLAGFIPGPVREALGPGHLSGKRIFVAHGSDDDTIPIDHARRAAEALRQAGAEVSYHEYPTGHRLNARGMADLTAWFGSVAAGW